ncbi:MAG: hypothetical protein QOI20_836 [Acidimicrobiaceae bacterium]|nr:hypothetical protein [Acidimicrobiaceae bacterium]
MTTGRHDEAEPEPAPAPRPDIVVRPAEAGDFDAWMDVFEQVAAEGKWIGTELPIDRDARQAGFERTLADDNAVNLLAVDRASVDRASASPSGEGEGEGEGQVVGHLFLAVAAYGVADLGMAILEQYRGRGVGSLLMAAGIEFARDHGAHKIALQLWPHNAGAQALYEKFGFEVEGRLRRHLPRRNGELWDAVVMGLVLDHDRPGSPY